MRKIDKHHNYYIASFEVAIKWISITSLLTIVYLNVFLNFLMIAYREFDPYYSALMHIKNCTIREIMQMQKHFDR